MEVIRCISLAADGLVVSFPSDARKKSVMMRRKRREMPPKNMLLLLMSMEINRAG